MWASIIAIFLLIFFFGGLAYITARIWQLNAAEKFIREELDKAYTKDMKAIEDGIYDQYTDVDILYFFDQLDKTMPWNRNFSAMLKVKTTKLNINKE